MSYVDIIINSAEIKKDPSFFNNTDAVTKYYVDNQISNLDINQKISNIQQQIDQKLDSSNNYLKDNNGNLKIAENSYLYIGNNWRIFANNSTSPHRLEFQHSNDEGVTWSIGVPFIRASS